MFTALKQQGSVNTKGQVDVLVCHHGDMMISEGCVELAHPSPGHRRRADHGDMRVGELTSPLASCSTQDSESSVHRGHSLLMSCVPKIQE